MPLASLSSTLTTFIGDYGLYAVFVLMAVDAVFPAASELVMVYAGALAAGAFAGQHVTLFGHTIATGFRSYAAMALAGTVGYLVGAIGGWGIGVYGGRPYLDRHGRWLHVSAEQLGRAERWFDRWDDWAVLVGRVTPLVRSFVSIPAGVFHTRLGRYIVLTLIGSAVWAFALAGVGWALGESYQSFHEKFRYLDYAVIGAGAALLAGYLIVRKRRSSTLARRAPDSPR